MKRMDIYKARKREEIIDRIETVYTSTTTPAIYKGSTSTFTVVGGVLPLTPLQELLGNSYSEQSVRACKKVLEYVKPKRGEVIAVDSKQDNFGIGYAHALRDVEGKIKELGL